MGKFKDLTGQKFNNWKVLEYLGNRYWKCECQCNKHTIKKIHASSLISGKSKSCGCLRGKIEDDLTGKRFGNWEVLGPSNNKDNSWICRCACEKQTIKLIKRSNLTLGKTRSCGCMKRDYTKNTLISMYGETVNNRVSSPREKWQIETLESPELFKEYIKSYIINNSKLPTYKIIADGLNVNRHTISARIHKLNLEKYININPLNSDEENQLLNFVEDLTKTEVIQGTRSVIYPYQLDIYIPDKEVAFEFNGNYWHSELKVKRGYHRNKTISCLKKHIRLIHIFEYEWIKYNDKIKNFISCILCDDTNTKYLNIIENDYVIDEVNNFIFRFALKEHRDDAIKIIIKNNEKLLGVMIAYEISHNSYKIDEIILSEINDTYGIKQLIQYFIEKHNPDYLEYIADLAKCNIEAFKECGFITENELDIEYKIVDTHNNIVDDKDYEVETAQINGYFKIFDCGKIKLVRLKE